MKKEKICGIYKITSPSKRIYIGQSIDIEYTWKDRYQKPIKKLERLKLQRLLYRSIKKYGWESHIFEIIEQCSQDKLNEKEIYYISFYRTHGTPQGMNCTLGGESTRGLKWTKESRKKIMGDGNPCRKREYTPEYRKNKSESVSGKSNPMYGRKHSKETRQKIGEKSKGRTHSAELRKNASIRMKNRKVSKESRDKLRQSKYKIVLNTETGIFYIGVESAADSRQVNLSTLYSKLNGSERNNTPFIYA